MSNSIERTISLFPIPNLVAFPGSVVPLHVFEPRYRQLVKDAVQKKQWVGVGHIEKVLSPAKPQKSTAEVLNSNQATYKPKGIFSAGPCEITEVTADGRLLAEVHMGGKFELKETVQTIPYLIVKAAEVKDDVVDDDIESMQSAFAKYRNELESTLCEIASSHGQNIKPLIESPTWQNLSPINFSYRILDFIQFESDFMQELLECGDPLERVKKSCSIIDSLRVD